jgi:glycosyltransferase involved in cell wall biosynthesis
LINSQLKRTNFIGNSKLGLRLFYPAATYPHKNHKILGEINKSENWPISELILTIPNNLNPNPQVDWIKCLGELQPKCMVDHYQTVDAILFLSLSESLGLPLVEAMWLGLPIICPDLPYAHILCGEQAIYFDPYDVSSLKAAVDELFKRRNCGWWPDWSSSLEKIPRDWDQVADSMLKIATSDLILQ